MMRTETDLPGQGNGIRSPDSPGQGDACDQLEVSCKRLTCSADLSKDEDSDEVYKGGGSDE